MRRPGRGVPPPAHADARGRETRPPTQHDHGPRRLAEDNSNKRLGLARGEKLGPDVMGVTLILSSQRAAATVVTMTTIASRRETVTMSASVVTRTPGSIRLGAGLAMSLGGAVPTAACDSSGSSCSSAPASSAEAAPVGGSANSSAVGSGSDPVITTKSGSAGAFLTDGFGRSVHLGAKDSTDSSACSGTYAGATPAEPTSWALGIGGY